MTDSHWDLAGNALERLLQVTLQHNPRGVGIDFVSNADITGARYPLSRDVRDFMDIFHSHQPTRKSFGLGEKIDGIISGRYQALKDAFRSNGAEPMTGLNLIILTNGGFVDRDDEVNEIERALLHWLHELDEYRYIPTRRIGMQFLQLDAAPKAQRILERFDNEIYKTPDKTLRR